MLFSELKNEEAGEVAAVANRLELLSGQDKLSLGQVANSLSATVNFAKASGATKARIEGLMLALACLPVARLESTAFEDFAEAMKLALKVDVVALHLSALEANLGKPGFDIVYAAMEKDRRVKAAEVAAIASKFVSQTSPSAPKRRTLQRIYARHVSLLDSENKSEWQKGKSAA